MALVHTNIVTSSTSYACIEGYSESLLHCKKILEKNVSRLLSLQRNAVSTVSTGVENSVMATGALASLCTTAPALSLLWVFLLKGVVKPKQSGF